MIGTREISGSDAISRRKCDHRFDAVEHPLIHIDVDDLGAVFNLLARYGQRFFVAILLDQLTKLRRAGDVCPLANIYECWQGHAAASASFFKLRLRAARQAYDKAHRPCRRD